MGKLTVKRGDTLSFEGAMLAQPVSLAGATLSCAMTLGATRRRLNAEITDAAAGAFRLRLSAAVSAALVPGLWRAEIAVKTAGGAVISTETFVIEVLKDIVNDA